MTTGFAWAVKVLAIVNMCIGVIGGFVVYELIDEEAGYAVAITSEASAVTFVVLVKAWGRWKK